MKARTKGTSPPARAARASRWILAAGVAGAALAIGTIHTITVCAVTIVLSVSATLAWWGAEPIKVRPGATLLLFTGIGLCVYTLLQCVPMPIRWLAAIAPHNADVWSRALAPLHDHGPAWAPITLDPVATRIELLKGVAYLLAFVTALRIAHRREGVGFLSAVIVGTGVVLGAAALLHPAFGAHKVFGIYEPTVRVDESHLAPMLNPNNLAGYLNIAFCLTFAASLSPEPRVPRIIALALALLLGATQVWVASRGGVVAMVLGAMILVVLGLHERVKRPDSRAWLTAAGATATLISVVLIVLGSSNRVQYELSDTTLGKLALPLDTLKMLPAYGILGGGRGAFESIYPQFRHLVPTGAGFLTFTNPENLLAQWTTEWGLPVGLGGLALIVFALRPTAAVARSRLASGAWAALVAIFVQNMADFGTEIPGVMLSVVVAAAIVVAGSAGHAPKWTVERWSRAPMLVAGCAATVALLALLGGATALGHNVFEDRRRMYEAATVHVAPLGEMHELARTAMLRHPAEPYLPFITALRGARARDDNPMPWLGASLERARVYAPAHLLLAHIIAPRSPSQARLEYRLALEQAPELGGISLQEGPRLVGSFDDAMELVPSGYGSSAMLKALVTELADRLPATCVRLDHVLRERAPESIGPPRREANCAAADVEAGDEAPWCQAAARPVCVERALSLARKLEQLDPATCEGYALEARVLTSAGQSAQAMDRLARVADTVGDRVACLRALTNLARSTGDNRRFDAALSEIVRAGCSDETECVNNLVWVAQAREASGNLVQALAIYRRAYERAPDNDSLLENIARLAGAAGLNAEALRNYQELEHRHPGDGRWRKAAEEQREAMLRGVIPL
jgi:tetratricopeptide (TPR) repeat protein